MRMVGGERRIYRRWREMCCAGGGGGLIELYGMFNGRVSRKGVKV